MRFLFWDPRSKSQILTPHPCPPFKNFSLDTLNSEQKPSVKKTGRLGRSETGRPAGQSAMILKFTGRVEKILTSSISDSNSWPPPLLKILRTLLGKVIKSCGQRKVGHCLSNILSMRFYIGKTDRSLETRKREHIDAVKNFDLKKICTDVSMSQKIITL